MIFPITPTDRDYRIPWLKAQQLSEFNCESTSRSEGAGYCGSLLVVDNEEIAQRAVNQVKSDVR